MIKGVIKTNLQQFEDKRGKVMHMLRSDDPHFKKFGEVYFSWINPGVIKGWKLHTEMEMNFAVPVGNIKLVLYDAREGSESFGMVQEFFMGTKNYYLLTIPNNIWYGFEAEGPEPAMIVNCSTLAHDPSEVYIRDIKDPSIPFSWEKEAI